MTAASRLTVSFVGCQGCPRYVAVWATRPTIYWPAETREHGARFHIHGPHGIREEHDAEDEPRSHPANGLLGDPPDIEGRRTQVVQDNGGRTPKRDEGEHDRGGHD